MRGAIAPRVGADGKPYETRFELRLPTEWTGRFFYQGGGGNDGSVAPAIGRNTGSFNGPALARGFAVVTTDAGHQGGSAEFALDPTARIDHAYAAHERTATTAKTLIARYYGRRPERSYFVGCSGGGRQGMMFAQRYPDYFDGIVACAPAMSVSSGATIAAAWDTTTFDAIAPAGPDGRRVLSRAFSPSDLELVANGILAACDAADGVVDRMVQRVEACRFDPAVLRCARGEGRDVSLDRPGRRTRARVRRAARLRGPEPVRRSAVGSRYCGAGVAPVEARHVGDRHAQRGQHHAHGGRVGLRVLHAARPIVLDRRLQFRSRPGAHGGVLA